jgi:hypothetical protein
MTKGKLGPTLAEVKALLVEDRDFLRPLVPASCRSGSRPR